jgi:hypothetical protein
MSIARKDRRKCAASSLNASQAGPWSVVDSFEPLKVRTRRAVRETALLVI